jgi:hypothetical protein
MNLDLVAPPTPTPPAWMPHVYTIGTMNVNGITSATRLQMLDQFVKRHDFDILLL